MDKENNINDLPESEDESSNEPIPLWLQGLDNAASEEEQNEQQEDTQPFQVESDWQQEEPETEEEAPQSDELREPKLKKRESLPDWLVELSKFDTVESIVEKLDNEKKLSDELGMEDTTSEPVEVFEEIDIINFDEEPRSEQVIDQQITPEDHEEFIDLSDLDLREIDQPEEQLQPERNNEESLPGWLQEMIEEPEETLQEEIAPSEEPEPTFELKEETQPVEITPQPDLWEEEIPESAFDIEDALRESQIPIDEQSEEAVFDEITEIEEWPSPEQAEEAAEEYEITADAEAFEEYEITDEVEPEFEEIVETEPAKDYEVAPEAEFEPELEITDEIEPVVEPEFEEEIEEYKEIEEIKELEEFEEIEEVEVFEEEFQPAPLPEDLNLAIDLLAQGERAKSIEILNYYIKEDSYVDEIDALLQDFKDTPGEADSDVWETIGDIALKKGKPESALEAYSTAINQLLQKQTVKNEAD